MNKKILKGRTFLKNRNFWLVVLVVIIGLYTGFFRSLFVSPVSGDTARVEIDFGSHKRAFEGEITDGMSVLDAILVSTQAGALEFNYALLNDQTSILRIDGVVEDGLSEKGWNFYLNGGKIKREEIHRIKIKSGDKISVRFE